MDLGLMRELEQINKRLDRLEAEVGIIQEYIVKNLMHCHLDDINQILRKGESNDAGRENDT